MAQPPPSAPADAPCLQDGWALLAFDETTGRPTHASANWPGLEDSASPAPLDALVPPALLDAVRAQLASSRCARPVQVDATPAPGAGPVVAHVHRRGGLVLLELERDVAPPEPGTLRSLRRVLARLGAASDVASLRTEAARSARELLHHDNVCLCLIPAEDGAVASAACSGTGAPCPELPPGFPGKGRLAFVADTEAPTHPLLRLAGAEEATPPDVSLVQGVARPWPGATASGLRSAIAAGIDAPSGRRGTLVCWSATPRSHGLEDRLLLEAIAQGLANALAALAAIEEATAATQAARAREILARLHPPGADWPHRVASLPDSPLDLLPCSGVAVVVGGAVHRRGAWASDDEALALAARIMGTSEDLLRWTDAAPAVACLAARLRTHKDDCVLWLRRGGSRAGAWTACEERLAREIAAALGQLAEASEQAATRDRRRQGLRVRQAIAAVSEGILIEDEHGEIVLANPGYLELLRALGLSGEPRSLAALALRLDPPGLARQLIEKADASGRAHEPDVVLRGETGPPRHVSITLARLRGELGEDLGRLTVMSDLTSTHAAQEEAARLGARLAQIERIESLSMLAGGVAHDFNNLLAGILGAAGLALEDIPEDSPARDSLHLIEKSTQRAAELTRQMLAYSGRGRFLVQCLDLPAFLRNQEGAMAALCGERLRLVVEPGAQELLVEADPAQLRQCLQILVRNAMEAMGRRPGTITLSAVPRDVGPDFLAACHTTGHEKPGPHAALVVADEGEGIEAHVLPRIFDPFFSTRGAGRGLGLAAVQGIARGHAGYVRAESTPGQGSRVELGIPLAASRKPRGDAQRAAPATSPARLRRRALVIDDEPAVRHVIGRQLERDGMEVLLAEDGLAGLELWRAQRESLDVILLDMTMPGMSGDRIANELLQEGCRTPILIMSGYSRGDALREFGVGELAGFLQKPFSAGELRAAVEAALDPRLETSTPPAEY